MGENAMHRSKAKEIIEAFDRERAEAHEHRRRHIEWMRTSREKDRLARDERHEQQ